MPSVLRRVLWLLPTLLVLSAVAFLLCSTAMGRRGVSGLSATTEPLPRFVNPNPRDCRVRALAALQQLSHGDVAASRAAEELARLGGAALPHVLPRLDDLAPTTQTRLAKALMPVARRMALPGIDEVDSPSSEVAFWRRFWQDRAADFQPVVVKRLVRRLAERNLELRRDDVIELDTYALPELIAALPRIGSASDVTRASRITSVAAQIVGNDWTIGANASEAEAQRVTALWRHWWMIHHREYTTFDGPRRVVAMVTETQYGVWALRALREGLGSTTSGRPVASLFAERAPLTLWLVGMGLIAGYLCGIVLGLVQLTLRPTAEHALSALAVLLLAIPAITFATWIGGRGSSAASLGLAALIMTLVSTALVSRHQRAGSLRRMSDASARTARAYGASERHVVLRTLRTSSVAAVSLVGVDLPALLGTAFVVEPALGLRGLGEATWRAVASRDVTWLMGVGLSCAVGVALVQIVGDIVLAELNPQIRSALFAKRGRLR